MKNYLLFVGFTLVFQVSLLAQWLPASGINGAYSKGIVHVGSSLFMDCEGLGIVKQKTDSASWTVVYPHQLWKLMQAGNVLLAHSTSTSGGTSKLIRSFDEGTTWDTVFLETYNADYISVDTTIFVKYQTANENGIFKSGDYGQSWEKAVSLTENTSCYLYSDDLNLYYSLNSGPLRLYFSGNQGNSFDSIPLPSQLSYAGSVQAVQHHGQSLFLVADSIYRYSFADQLWQASSNENHIVSFTLHNDILYGCGNGIFRFAPETNQWMPCDSGLMPLQTNKLVFAGDMSYCSNSHGCSKSDSTFIWQPDNTGLNGANIYQTAARANEIWACTSLGLYKSSDGGITFALKSNVPSDSYYKIILTDSLYFLSNYSGISVSSDFGETWVNHPIDSLSVYSNVADFDIGSQYIFAVTWNNTGERLFRTKYSPMAWEAVPGSEISYAHYLAVHDTVVMISKFSSDNIPNPVYISYNNGENMSPASFIQQAYSVKVKYENGKFFALNRNRLYYSDDNGISWESMTVSDPEFELSDVSQLAGTTIAAGWYYEYIPKAYGTYNNGTSWINLAGNLSDPLAYIFTCSMISGNRTFIGTHLKGLWYRDDLLTGLTEMPAVVNSDLRIIPNPAHDQFDVQFNSRHAGQASICITDLNGKILYFNGNKAIQPGSNKLQMKANNLSAGVYLLSLTTQDANLSSKLVISR